MTFNLIVMHQENLNQTVVKATWSEPKITVLSISNDTKGGGSGDDDLAFGLS